MDKSNFFAAVADKRKNSQIKSDKVQCARIPTAS